MYAVVLTGSSAIMAHMPLKYAILFHCALVLCQIILHCYTNTTAKKVFSEAT